MLTSPDGNVTDSRPVTNLSTSQEEADTIIILHSLYADTEAEKEDLDIIVRSSDMDVFILLLSYCHKFKQLSLF